MEPYAEEIYVARTKAALEKLGVEFHFDGRFSIAVMGYNDKMRATVKKLIPIDVSATAPEHIASVIFQAIYEQGRADGYNEYKSKVKDLIG